MRPSLQMWTQTGKWALPNTTKFSNLAKNSAQRPNIKMIGENPEIIGRLMTVGALDFAAIMPAWNMVDVPIRAVINRAGDGFYGQWDWGKAYHGAFSPQQVIGRDHNGQEIKQDLYDGLGRGRC